MSSFTQVLDEIRATHDKKQADYGSDDDPFANIRASELFGFPAWVGAVMRIQDKIHRIQAFSRKGRLVNETVEDSLLDSAVYSVIALVMYREEKLEQGSREARDNILAAGRTCRAIDYDEETGVCCSCNARPHLGEAHMSWCKRDQL